MRSLTAKWAGPVKTPTSNSETVVLECSPAYVLATLVGLLGLLLLWVSARSFNPMPLLVGLWGLATSVSLLFSKSRILISAPTKSLHVIRRRPWLPWRQKETLRLTFDEIHEFLVDPEFALAPNEFFVWHLSVVDTRNARYPLTWHYCREPVWTAAHRAARVTGKPVREESDPLNSTRWHRWGYHFLR